MAQRHYFVYILLCADSTYYVGVTNNVERRFAQHQEGLNERSYTYSRRPLQLMLVEWFHDPLQAIGREKQIKRWSKAKKKALIEGDMAALRFNALAMERRTMPPLSREERG